MRLIRYLVLAIIAITLIFVAMANTGPVELNMVPDAFKRFVPFAGSITLPLFVVLMGCVAAGLLIGFIWEWLREMKIRSEARAEHKQVIKLQREVDRLKSEKTGDQDEILALLDAPK